MKILNFGSLNIDYVYQVKHHVRGGETISSLSMQKFCGGKGLNQSAALARAGAEVYHAGCIGEDGGILTGFLKECGADIQFIRIDEGPSGHAVIQVDENGENCIILHGGANQKITEEQIDSVLSRFQKGDLILLQNEINFVDKIILKASEKGMLTALNPSPINAAVLKLPLEKIDYFILNEIEGKELSGREDADGIISELRKKYKNSRIVLTLGSAGSIYDDGKVHAVQGAYKVKAVDTTAAGDTFTGYFLQAVSEGKTPEEALDLAARASAVTVSRSGAAPSIPRREEILRQGADGSYK